MTRKGFTLIELLVVIAIVAILAAILMPVFAKAREKAKQATCLSNIKQITLAVLQYCSDYDGYGPTRTETPTGGEEWAVKLGPYGAPRWSENGSMMGMWMCTSGAYISYYSMPYQRAGYYMAYSGVLWSIDQSTHPTDDLLVCESGVAAGPAAPMLYATQDSALRPKGYWSAWVYYPIAPAHGNGNNESFFDGHAKWIDVSTMESQWGNMVEWRN